MAQCQLAPPPRPLDPPDGGGLAALAARVAPDEARWRDAAPARPGQRTFARVHAGDHVEVWVIRWGADDHDTGFHDHGTSTGAIAVAAGTVVEEQLVLGGPPARRTLTASAVVGFDETHVHRVRFGGGEAAVTLHAYSPRPVQMGRYVVGPGGSLRRELVDADTELRPTA